VLNSILLLPAAPCLVLHAELEIGHGSGREGATSSVTLGTLQGGLQPGNTGDVADSDGRSPRKLGEQQRAITEGCVELWCQQIL
jgi:hypothetical protein